MTNINISSEIYCNFTLYSIKFHLSLWKWLMYVFGKQIFFFMLLFCEQFERVLVCLKKGFVDLLHEFGSEASILSLNRSIFIIKTWRQLMMQLLLNETKFIFRQLLPQTCVIYYWKYFNDFLNRYEKVCENSDNDTFYMICGYFWITKLNFYS